MNNLNYEMGFGVPTWMHTYGIIVLIIMLWSLVWKGLALWHYSKRKDWKWFIALMIVNTAGILELIYLFVILKLKMVDLFVKD